MKHRLALLLLFVGGFSPVCPALAGPESTPSVAEAGLFWPALDLALPGSGMIHNDRYVLAGTIAFVRVSTAFLAINYRNRAREYRSAQQAARVADVVYGPGLRYRDPYSGDYLTSDGFGRRADRRQYISGLALSLHLAVALWSAAHTYRFEQQEALERAPIFEMQPEAGVPRATHQGNGLRWVIGMRWTTR